MSNRPEAHRPTNHLTWSTQPWRSLKPGQCTYIPRFLAFLRKAGSSGGVHSNSSQGSPQNPSSSWLPLDRQSATAMKQAFRCLCDLFLPLSTYSSVYFLPSSVYFLPSSVYLPPQHDLMPKSLLLPSEPPVMDTTSGVQSRAPWLGFCTHRCPCLQGTP